MRFLITATLLILLTSIMSSCNKGPLISKGEIFKNLTQITFSKSNDYSPVISKDGTKLLFVSDRDGDQNIYLKNNILSKAVVKKTSHKASDINPSFSPDGSKFCFASDRNGNYDIFVMNLERGFAKTQITTSSNHDLLPNWSPDGDLIVFTQYSVLDKEWYIWTKNLSTGQLTQICKGTFPVFSVDSKKIFYKKMGKNYYELWQIEIIGENDTQLLSNEDWGIASFNLSPDGSKIIYSTVKSEFGRFVKKGIKSVVEPDGFDLWVLDLSNGNQIQVTTHKGSDFDPSWSKTGAIYFASTRMGNTNIWTFKPTF